MEKSVEPPRRQDAKENAKVMEPPAELDQTARKIVDAAMSVHRVLGPGLLESVYERCLAYELKSRNLAVAQQVPADVKYKELMIESGFRIDMIVESGIIVEIKAVERLLPLHEAQLLTYLKITGTQVGLLINFNTPRLKDGLRRLVNSSALASWRLGG